MLISKLVKGARDLANSRDRNFHIQRWVGDVRKRERYADALAAKAPAYQTAASEDLSSRMKKEGYCPLANIIESAWIPEMVDYFKGRDCFDPYRAHLGEFRAPTHVPPVTHVANYSAETVASSPRAFTIANHPDVLALVAATLGAKPTIALMSAWWSLPRADGKPEHAEMFHRDVDDYRFIKLFCYLTDVDEASGPHVFVRGSHSVNKLTEAKRRLPDDLVAQEFGADNILRFTGPAGTTFLENTYGVHRGIPAASKSRLIFQVLYALRPLIYSPKKPFIQSRANAELAQLDPYINRVYLS